MINEKLYSACINGNYKNVVTYLSNGANINYINNDNTDLLYAASIHNHKKIVDYLLKKKISVHHNNCIMNNNLLQIVIFNDSIDIFKKLIYSGINPEMLHNNITPFIYACLYDNIEIVKILLTFKININHHTNNANGLLLAVEK